MIIIVYNVSLNLNKLNLPIVRKILMEILDKLAYRKKKHIRANH